MLLLMWGITAYTISCLLLLTLLVLFLLSDVVKYKKDLYRYQEYVQGAFISLNFVRNEAIKYHSEPN